MTRLPRWKMWKSDSTMSTSENEKSARRFVNDATGQVLPGNLQSVPASVPDPEVLERMANEFFTALPAAQTVVPAAPYGAEAARGPQASIAGVSLGDFSADPTAVVPTEAQLRALPASLGAPDAYSQIPAGANTMPLGLPGGVDATYFTGPASLSFLEDIRPLFSYSAAPLPVADYPATIQIPTETELRAIANSFSSTTVPGVPQSTVDLAAPRVSGAAGLPTAAEQSGGYSFLNEIRQLVPVGLAPTEIPSDGLPAISLSSLPFDVQAIRRDFPILQERVHGKQLIWLDNAATTHKPQSVIDRLSRFYSHENSNIHRAAHELAARATDAYEAARDKVRRFVNAGSVREIIFVRGATEGINLVAQSWGRQNIQKDDEIVITWLEHHANIVPWQMLCAEKGARLRVAPVDDSGQVILDEYQKLLGQRTRLVAFAEVSNALGTVTPAQEMIEMAHRYGAKVLLDGAQAVSHMQTDVQSLDCDFYVFSGHKMFAPTGIGVVFGKLDILENTQPWHGGGNMIQDVTFEKTTYQTAPGRFEAGTGNIADAVGLGAAIDYLERVGMVNISRYEHDLLLYATERLQRIPGLRLIGTAREKAGVLSFELEGYRTEDVGAALNRQGIAVRAGHHCAQPILRRFGVESTVRPSLALYNTCEEIDALVAAIWNLKQGHTSI
jgi:cysteine desulfurase/selenocysteine lyase